MTTGNPKFAGLTDDQVQAVLEKIASDLDLVATICRNEAMRFGDHESAYAFHSIDSMLTGVGALADMASGGGVVGDVYAWFCGPNFYREGDTPRALTQGGAARSASQS